MPDNGLMKVSGDQIKALEQLSNANAVSGDEGEVRKIVIEQARSMADEVSVDALGNVLVKRFGEGENRLRVMLAAHMDEVGLMLTHDEGEGIFRFKEGLIYPRLHQMEREGLLDSRWLGEPGTRRRKVYTVTDAGRRQLEAELRQWETVRRGMSLLLGLEGSS